MTISVDIRLYYLPLAAMLALPDYSHSNTAVLSPGYVIPPAQTITATPQTLGGGGSWTAQPGPAYCKIYAYISGPEHGSSYLLVDNSYRGRGSSCFGVTIGPDHMNEYLNSILYNIPSYPMPYAGVHSIVSPVPVCLFSFEIRTDINSNVYSWATGYAGCKLQPLNPQTYCYVHAPQPMIHPPSPTGYIRSTSGRSVDVSCSQETNLTVSIDDSSLPLRGGKGQIASTLYVGANGHSSVRVKANPNAAVPLISDINTTAAIPDVYQGSKVLIISWD